MGPVFPNIVWPHLVPNLGREGSGQQGGDLRTVQGSLDQRVRLLALGGGGEQRLAKTLDARDCM